MTYSIVARDSETGHLGVAVQSHFFAVGSIVTWARAGVGAVATQAFAEVSYGPRALALLADGQSPDEALARLVDNDGLQEVRQVGVVDYRGRTSAHTGTSCVPFAGHLTAEGVSVQANMMARETVCAAMIETFMAAGGDLATRLLAVLDAAEREGGDMRGRQSAALVVVEGERHEDPWGGVISDSRVDDHPDPLAELRRLVTYGNAYRYLGEALFARGGVIGEYDYSDTQLEDVLRGLEAAQEIVAPNPEPTFWRGVLAARAGRADAARAAFATAARTRPELADFARRLSAAGLIPAETFDDARESTSATSTEVSR